jgi:hypothetical protein
LVDTPSVQSVHDYYPSALENGGRLAPMAAELVDRMAILVAVRRFPGMIVAYTLVHCVLTVMSAFIISFVDLFIFPFDAFGEMRGKKLCNFFLVLFMVLWVPIFATLSRRALQMLWHDAFMYLGLRHVAFSPPYSFLLGGFHCLFL